MPEKWNLNRNYKLCHNIFIKNLFSLKTQLFDFQIILNWGIKIQ